MKIYYKQQQFLRQAHRQIKNYDNSEDKSSIQSSHIAHPSSAPSLPATSTSFVRHDYAFNDANPTSSTAVNTNSTIASDNSLHGNSNNNSASVNNNNNNINNSNIILARRSRNTIRPNSSPIGDFTFNEEDSSLPDLIIPTSTVINANSYTPSSNDEIQDS